MNIQAALVKSILESYDAFDWTVQGFGMVRTKIADVGRIHIWDSRVRQTLVSDIHAHPWNLKSTIISGELINQRFTVLQSEPKGEHWLPYSVQKIATGEGGGLVDAPEACWLMPNTPEFYSSGDTYQQFSDEVHRTIPMDGTVTLMERSQGPPLQETYVYWPKGAWWVSAEPRKATPQEVESACYIALGRWNV